MNPVLSIWLDACRILAAFAVFLGHAVGLGVAPSVMGGQWHRSADDAVTAFFIISGFVIAHTTQQRADQGLRAYVVARASRLYSVALPAILFVYALDHVGMWIDPSPYVPEWQYPRAWLYIPLHLAFMGETWLGAFQPFPMAPYWSLSYAAFLQMGWQKGLDQASKDLYAAFSQVLPVPFSSGSTVHVLSDYAMAMMFSAFLVGCAHSRLEIGGRAADWIRRLAAYTFTFYLLHFTLFVFCNALGWRQVGAWHFVGITLATFAITWAHAQVGELRRHSYAKVIDRLLPGKG